MTTLDAHAQGLMESIRTARLDQSSIAGEGDDVDLASAYRIQAALGEGRLAKGYKLTCFDGQADTLVHGRVYADMLLEGPVSLGRFLRPGLAVRLAVVLGEDLRAGSGPGSLDLAVGGMFLAVELTDSVWADGEATLVGAVADNASAGAFALGERLLSSALRGSAVLSLGGRVVSTYPLSAYDHVSERLAWLAGQVGGLCQGEIVLLGSHTGDEPVKAASGPLELVGPDGSLVSVQINP